MAAGGMKAAGCLRYKGRGEALCRSGDKGLKKQRRRQVALRALHMQLAGGWRCLPEEVTTRFRIL